MIKNYFKIAWRSLWKHKAYSVINIVGLSIGLTACLIVASVVVDELSYDRQWSKGDDIYRVLTASTDVKGDELMPVAFAGLGPSLKKDLPEVADYCRMSVNKERLVLNGDKEGVAFQAMFAEPSIWNVLDFTVTEGDPHKYVKGYTNMVITEKMRRQYFAGKDPIGKVITSVPEYGDPQHYLITGVIKSIPQNSHLRADFITLSEYRGQDNRMPKKGEGYSFFPQYILLRHGTSAQIFTAKANKWYADLKGGKPDYYFRNSMAQFVETQGLFGN